jgi:capsular exopolysaccharide synthesis family protein
MEKKGESGSRLVTVITVNSGKPDQVADVTQSCTTTPPDWETSPGPNGTARMSPEKQQPGRALSLHPAGRTTSEIAPEATTNGHSAATITPAPVLAVAPSLQGLLSALRRRWQLASALGLCTVVVAGIAAWFLLPPAKYESEAFLQVDSRQPSLAFSTPDNQNQPGDDYRRYQKTQIALVKSRPVLTSALQRSGIEMFRTLHEVDLEKYLKEHLDVSFVQDSEIMRIALKGDDAAGITTVVNGITESYMEEIVNKDRNRRTLRYDTLRQLNLRKQELLKKQKEEVRRLAETLGSNKEQALVLKQQYAIDSEALIKKELLQVRSDRRKVEAELKARERVVETVADATESPIDESELEDALDQHPTIQALQQRLADAESQLSQHSDRLAKTARHPGTDPMIKQLQSDARRARNELNERRKALRPSLVRDLKNRTQNKVQSSLSSLRHQLTVLDDLEKRLESERQQQEKGVQSISTKSLDLESIQDDIKQAQAATGKMGSEIQALEVELQAPARVRKVEVAVVPQTRDLIKWSVMFAMVVLGSLFATLFGVAFLESRAQRVTSANEVATGLGIRLIGTLPLQLVRSRRGNLERDREREVLWQNMMCESIDMTRTMLLNVARSHSGRVIIVTSAEGGESKTSLSCHLATSMARSGRRTLLIDADMRKPSLDRLFDQPLTPGLSEVLRGETSLEDVIASTSIPELKIIPAGECDSQTMSSLSQGGVEPLLEGLKARYDCVIIDSAPVLPVTDTLLIAPYTDGVLFSILTDVSRMPKVFDAYQRLTAIGARILGAVFTGERTSNYGPGYRERYDYARASVQDSIPEETSSDLESTLERSPSSQQFEALDASR